MLRRKTKFKKPKDKKMGWRDRRFYKKEIKEAREAVEKFGGPEAVVAARKKTSLKVHPEKRVQSMKYHETEVLLEKIEPMGNSIETKKGTLLMPDGFVRAFIKVPKEFRNIALLSSHVTSTYARQGVNITFSQQVWKKLLETKKIPEYVEIRVSNSGNTPIMLRKGDPCRIMNAPELIGKEIDIRTSPRTKKFGMTLDLHAGNKTLVLKKEALQTIKIHGKEVKYLDPRLPGIKDMFEAKSFISKKLEPGDFIVIQAKEKISIPKEGLGIVRSARDELSHATATLLHPGWEGSLALEFKVIRPMRITRGQHIGFITMHGPVVSPEKIYKGRYQKQETIVPKGKKEKKK